jgi:hypothetical protein
MSNTARYRLGDLRPGAQPGFQWPRPVIGTDGYRVGWADSDDGPALVGPLDDEDLAAWAAEGRFTEEPETFVAYAYGDGAVAIRRDSTWLHLDPEPGDPPSVTRTLAAYGWQGARRYDPTALADDIADVVEVWEVWRRAE